MRRLPQLILIASTVPLVWLWMQILHECGHVLLGWCTGGEVRRVILHPLTISRTDLDANPFPLVLLGGAGVWFDRAGLGLADRERGEVAR